MDWLRRLYLSAYWVTVPGALAFNKYSLAKTLYLTLFAGFVNSSA